MFVADSEEELRRVVREETRAAYRELIGTVSSTSDPEQVLSYEAAGALSADASKDTVRAWVSQGKLKKYGTGKKVGVKRRELMELLARGDTTYRSQGQGQGSRVDAVLNKRKDPRKGRSSKDQPKKDQE